MKAKTSWVLLGLMIVAVMAHPEQVAMKLSSPSFAANQSIPKKFTGAGADSSRQIFSALPVW